MLFIIAGCNKPKRCVDKDVYIDCAEVRSFSEAFPKKLKDFKNPDFFLIKGKVLSNNSNNDYSNIEVIEDLKGNLAGRSSIVVWQTSCIEGDTLIMSLFSTCQSYENIEKFYDYLISPNCYVSILKFSNGYVIGYIYSLTEKTTLSWEEFLKRFNIYFET
jgi:hypothetical protein